MGRQIAAACASQHIKNTMLESGRFELRPGKTYSPVRILAATARISSARLEIGTSCSSPAFIRSLGIVQTFFFKVDFGPFRAERLACSGRREDGEFKRQRPYALLQAQIRTKAGTSSWGRAE